MKITATFTVTDLVAWWGAIVATIVFLWDIYKWKTAGAKIRLLVQSGMQIIGDPQRGNLTLVTARVTNIGDRPTTITTIGFKFYTNWWQKIRNKPNQAYVVPHPELNHQVLPYILEVGQEWQGGTNQTDDLEKMAKEGYLIMEVYDSVHMKPSSGRVIISAK